MMKRNYRQDEPKIKIRVPKPTGALVGESRTYVEFPYPPYNRVRTIKCYAKQISDDVYMGYVVRTVELREGETLAPDEEFYFDSEFLGTEVLSKELCAEDPLNTKYLLCPVFQDIVAEAKWHKEDHEYRNMELRNAEKLDFIVRIPIGEETDFVYDFDSYDSRCVMLHCKKEYGVWFVEGKMVFPDAIGKYLTYNWHP